MVPHTHLISPYDSSQQNERLKYRSLWIVGMVLLFLSCFFLPCLAPAGQSPADQHQLKSAGNLDYPPFAIVQPDGTVGGFSVELLQAAVEAAGLSVSFKVGPGIELMEELASGTIDVLPLVAYSSERDKIFDFTVPYLQLNGAVFVRKGNKDISEFADLKDKEVLVRQGGGAHEYLVRQNLTEKIFPTASYAEAFTLLDEGQHDALMVPQFVGLQLLKELHLTNVVAVQQRHINILKPVVLRPGGFEQSFCFAVRDGDRRLLSQLNEGLSALYFNGTYQTLFDKWLVPILPSSQHTAAETAQEFGVVLVPLFLIFTLGGMWYLRRQVARRTRHLEEELHGRRRAEKELEEANNNYIKAQQIGHVGNWEYCLVTKKYSGSMEAKRIYGLDASAPSFIAEEVELCVVEKERVRRAFRDLVDNGTPFRMDFDIIARDKGERRSIFSVAELERDATNQPVKIRGVIQDVTERKKVVDALHKSERLLNEMGAIGRIGGWEHDLLSNAVTWTREIFKIVELETGIVPCQDELLNYYPPEDREVFGQAYLRAVKTGEPFDLELQIVTAKGRMRWARGIGTPEFKLGRCIKMRGTFQDITERKKMEERLQQTQKLEAVAVLAGGIAHDFNNILSAILGFTELAKDSHPTDRELQEDLSEIYTAGLRAKELVQQLLTFSRNREHSPASLNVPVIAKEIIKTMRFNLPASIHITANIDEKVSPILAEPAQIHQILMNICTNAAQAMSDHGGTLTIGLTETTLVEREATGHVGPAPGRYLKLQVHDSGEGIPPEIIGSIFDPYFTTKNQGDGTGLGLAVAYGIVKKLGGDISVESEPDSGSVFTVFLPVINQHLN